MCSGTAVHALMRGDPLTSANEPSKVDDTAVEEAALIVAVACCHWRRPVAGLAREQAAGR
jgi:hypothetical protein